MAPPPYGGGLIDETGLRRVDVPVHDASRMPPMDGRIVLRGRIDLLTPRHPVHPRRRRKRTADAF
jgi:hypothetical protein